MKKLLTIFIFMAIATMANASIYNWSSASFAVKKPTDSSAYLSGAIGYLIFGTSDLTATTNAATAMKGTILASNWDASVAHSNKTSNVLGQFAPGTTQITSTATAGSKSYCYVVTFDSADMNYFMISSAKEVTFGDGADIAGVNPTWSEAELKATTGGWIAVPEPTALALLALGVAGLALRRKRV